MIPPNASEEWPARGVPLDPYATLKRREATDALQKIGRPHTYKTLNTLACRAGGPPYKMFGGLAIYEWGSLLKWTEERMTATRTTATEGRALAEKVARNRASYERRDARNKTLRMRKPSRRGKRVMNADATVTAD